MRKIKAERGSWGGGRVVYDASVRACMVRALNSYFHVTILEKVYILSEVIKLVHQHELRLLLKSQLIV